MTIEEIKKTRIIENLKNKKTQEDYYIEKNASTDIIKLVKLNNKSFGETNAKIVIKNLKLDPPSNPGHDAQKKSCCKKIEIKSSRFWVGISDWKWQHIMVDHDYDYLLLCGINFHSIDVFIISKSDFISLKDKGLVKQQGKAEGQGLWCSYKDIKNHLTIIKSVNDINNFIK